MVEVWLGIVFGGVESRFFSMERMERMERRTRGIRICLFVFSPTILK
jgi:hypothetical protein